MPVKTPGAGRYRFSSKLKGRHIADWCITSSTDVSFASFSPLPSLFFFFFQTCHTCKLHVVSPVTRPRQSRAGHFSVLRITYCWDVHFFSHVRTGCGQNIELQRRPHSWRARFCFANASQKRPETAMKTKFSPNFEGQPLEAVLL